MPPKGYKLESRKMLHGATKGGRSPTWRVWIGMIERCHDTRNPAYSDYGGRGIVVCEAWRESFAAFLADMGERPQGKSIDRINNDGGYEPSNCRWATNAEQSRNRRNNIWLALNGERLVMNDWAKRLDVSWTTLKRRRQRGWSDERILTTPFRYHGPRVAKHKNEGASNARG